MPDADLIYYQLRPEYGIDHAGNLEPIVDFGLSIPAPQFAAGEVLPTAASRVRIQEADELTDDVHARVIPRTRIIETRDLRIATAVHALGLFERIEPPTKKAISEAQAETRAHDQAMKAAAKQVELGNDPAPDATDAMDPADIPPTIQHEVGESR